MAIRVCVAGVSGKTGGEVALAPGSSLAETSRSFRAS